MKMVRVTIMISEDMYKPLKVKASSSGVSVQDYIRHLVIKDNEEKK